MERLMQNEDLAERDSVLRRVLSATLALAELAHREEYGGDYTVLHGSAPRWQPPGGWADTLPARPMDWWNAEHRSLVVAVREAAAAGLDELCWDLALTLVTMFEANGSFDDWQETARLGLEVTERAGNRVGQAAMLYSLGTLNIFRKRLTEARRYLTSALDIFRADANTHGCALVLRNGAIIDGFVGDFRTMVEKYGEALELMRTVGDDMGEAQILRSLAMYWIDEGDTDRAREMLEEALAICRRVNCRRGEAQVLHRYAFLQMHNGQIDQAVREFERVVHIVRDIGDRIGEVYALYGLGVGRFRQGKLAEGEADLLDALASARMMGERMVEGQALHTLGEIGLAKGEGGTGEKYLTEACRVFEELGSMLSLAKSMTLLSRHHADVGALAEANEEATRARSLLSKVDSKEATRWLSMLNEPRSAPASDDSARHDADLKLV
jgi:tetratricopeptide (TPR) repeat protein